MIGGSIHAVLSQHLRQEVARSLVSCEYQYTVKLFERIRSEQGKQSFLFFIITSDRQLQVHPRQIWLRDDMLRVHNIEA